MAGKDKAARWTRGVQRRRLIAGFALLAGTLGCVVTQAQGPSGKTSDAAVPPPGVVARVFGKAMTAKELGWSTPADLDAAARRLRAAALRDAMERYLVEHKLAATAEDFSAFSRWDQSFRQVEGQKRRARLVQLDEQLKTQMEDGQRKLLEQERGVLEIFGRLQEQRSARPLGPGDEQRAMKVWIEGHKLRKALHERYGGRVGMTPFGPDPVGATEAWLKEHEKAGRLTIINPRLAASFWAEFAREPRQAARPEQIDFDYYWLKPVPML